MALARRGEVYTEHSVWNKPVELLRPAPVDQIGFTNTLPILLR